MPLPSTYRKSGEGAVASYDYTDISEGTGIVTYGALNLSISGASFAGILTKAAVSSFQIETTGTSWTFDLTPFNSPKRVRGTAYVYFRSSEGAADRWFEVYLKKVDALGVVTTLGHTTTTKLSTGNQYCTTSVALTATNFKKGDYLRLVIEGIPGGGTITLAHDPGNRAGVTINADTKLDVFVPFNIDL